MDNYKKPFIGAAYYPEDWDETEIDYDISKMKEAGVTWDYLYVDDEIPV